MFIDANTSREDLLTAVYSDLDAVEFFMDRDLDPETMDTDAIRKTLTDFIEAGDECAAFNK